MRKETKIILILLAMALVVGCNSGCDGGEGVTLDDETIHTLLCHKEGWVAQEDYEINGYRVASLFIENDPITGFSFVYFRDPQEGQVGDGQLKKGEEDYFMVSSFGEFSLKVSANTSMDEINLTLTCEDGTKYYFALSDDT